MKRSVISKIRLSAGMVTLFLILGMMTNCSKSDLNGNNGGDGSKGGPGANEVWIENMAFNPVTINVAVNTTVKWTNKDGITHNVTSNTGVFSSGNMGNNATFSFTFTTAGNYPYKCTIHPSMTGTVVVN